MLIAFYIGYIVGVGISYLVVRSVGTRLPLSIALIVAGVATAALPVMPAPRNNVAYGIGLLVFVCRLVAGIACSMTLPSFHALLRLWLGPLEQRSAAFCMTIGANVSYL